MPPNPAIGRILLLSVAAAGFLILLIVAVASRREKEPRAARVAALLALLLPMPYLVTAWFDFPGRVVVTGLLLLLPVVVFLLWLIPIPGRRYAHAEPVGRIDERTVMFSRMALQPGTERFEDYYREFPEHRPVDDAWRATPGLTGAGSAHEHPWLFAAAEASFETIEPLHALVDGEPAPVCADINPERLTRFLTAWTAKLGAVSVGVAELRDEHWYSVTGRRDPYGVPADLPHTRGLAFTVEMDKAMLDHAPRGPVIAESAQQYLAAATIAVQVAVWLRSQGFAARAHIDANYRVVCPLVARDAGLGEIGRMGLLMTPELGPRVRVGVVTTDAPLLPAKPTRDESILDFCTICEKCADICPSDAIKRGPRRDIDTVRRWQIDQEKCFSFWCRIGTDCGRCVQVCPYSHPDNFMHSVVRSGVGRSAPFRRVALWLDDLFYGRRPASRELAGWKRK